jgi:hypothetical protein
LAYLIAAREIRWKPVITLIDGGEYTVGKADHECFHRTGRKVNVKASLLKQILPGTKVIRRYVELWSNNVRRLLNSQDIIIAFTDVNNMKWYLSDWIEANKKDAILITGGVHVDEDGAFVRIFLREDGKNLNPGIAHGIVTYDGHPVIDRNRAGFLGGRAEGGSFEHRNLLMSLLAVEVLQLFHAVVADNELLYDTVELVKDRSGQIVRDYYLRDEKYRAN